MAGKRSSRRKHSFGGCRTCRRRHVKCDQIRPSCLACRAVNAVCEGYAADLCWMPLSTISSSPAGQPELDDTSKNTTRHHLYSETSRASMSTELIDKLGSNTVDSSLAEIDARTKDLVQVEKNDFAVGPFSVFNVRIASHETTPSGMAFAAFPMPLNVDTNDGSTIEDSISNHEVNLLGCTEQVPALMDWFDPILGYDNTLHWADLFALDFDSGNSLLMQNEGTIESLHFLGNPIENGNTHGIEQNILQSTQIEENLPPCTSQLPSATDLPGNSTRQELNVFTLDVVKSVSEAQFLLKHFHDFVMPQMAFMPSDSKSPWTILQLPEAMHTLSELSYLHTGRLNHANAANFYGLMACSAYHLSANPVTESAEPTEYWENLFDRLRDQAKTHMQISLREELRGEKKAKYKDQLMAILTMLAFTSISGHQRDARCYMIDAERLLRMKGLAKREISRKCRVLHHVYSWIRIVGESTYVIHDYKSYGPVLDNMSAAHRAGRMQRGESRRAETARSGHNARLDDFLRLEPHSSDSDLDIDQVKECDGLHDIHLEDSRQFRGTMYHIYGISETWLSLVSQTTRLANILDASKYGQQVDLKFLDFLYKRAGRLENTICSFALKDPGSDEEGDDLISSQQTRANCYMLRAMNSALVILFYRRIRNVNPLILQGHVDTVVQSLRDFDAAIASQDKKGPGSPWPAFVAGCEALSRRNRKFLMDWLESGYEKCGLEYFGTSRQLMKEVWERQDEPTPILDPGSRGSNQSRQQKSASYHRTWVDISREKNIWVILF